MDRTPSDETGDPRLVSAAPPVWARVVAFLAILAGGVCGGLIGFAIVDLQCAGDCGMVNGLGALIGAVLASIGVAVVAALVLRAMGEWRAIQLRSPTQTDNRNRRNPSA